MAEILASLPTPHCKTNRGAAHPVLLQIYHLGQRGDGCALGGQKGVGYGNGFDALVDRAGADGLYIYRAVAADAVGDGAGQLVHVGVVGSSQ